MGNTIVRTILLELLPTCSINRTAPIRFNFPSSIFPTSAPICCKTLRTILSKSLCPVKVGMPIISTHFLRIDAQGRLAVSPGHRSLFYQLQNLSQAYWSYHLNFWLKKTSPFTHISAAIQNTSTIYSKLFKTPQLFKTRPQRKIIYSGYVYFFQKDLPNQVWSFECQLPSTFLL